MAGDQAQGCFAGKEETCGRRGQRGQETRAERGRAALGAVATKQSFREGVPKPEFGNEDKGVPKPEFGNEDKKAEDSHDSLKNRDR